MALTADAIHNWTEAYIQRRYAALPEEVQAAAKAAMIRHHQKGTDAQVEADILNERYHLT
jgi:thioredoxin-like negative regulator of GroEL